MSSVGPPDDDFPDQSHGQGGDCDGGENDGESFHTHSIVYFLPLVQYLVGIFSLFLYPPSEQYMRLWDPYGTQFPSNLPFSIPATPPLAIGFEIWISVKVPYQKK